jgi:5-methylthioadenosine/S-adenosylhomocysteine deaminase
MGVKLMTLDIIIHGGYIITMEGNGTGVINDGAVGIKGNEIVAVGNTNDIMNKYTAHRYINAHNKAVMPGFIDCHIHTSDTIVRGGCQDIDNWMEKGIWPLLSLADDDALVAGSMVNIIEAVKAGTTTFCDYETPMLKLIPNHIKVGTRLVAANMINELPSNNKNIPGEIYPFDFVVGNQKLQDNIKMVEQYHGFKDNLITCMFGPQAVDMCSAELLLEIKNLAEKYDVGIHMHLAQGDREVAQMTKRYGKRSVEYAQELGLLDERLLAIHLTTATEEEVKVVAESGAGMVLCTGSIAILGGNLPPAEEFGKYSRRVGLGTDQSPGNNCNNMFNEMKFTSIAHKYKHRNGTSHPAWKVMRMATIEGARTLGMGNIIGSLKPGKKADIIIIDLTYPNLSPIMDWPIRNIVPNLVYAGRGNEVEMVIIDGEVIVEDHNILTVDEKEAVEHINKCAKKICLDLEQDMNSNDLPLAKWTREGYQ